MNMKVSSCGKRLMDRGCPFFVKGRSDEPDYCLGVTRCLF